MAGAVAAQGPVVTGLLPLRNAVAVPRATPVTISFDQPIGTSLATRQALKIFSQQVGGQQAGPATVSGNTLTKTPNAAFGAGETVFVTLTSAVQNSSETQNLLKPQVFQFTTATAPSLGTFGGGSDLPVGLDPTGVTVGDIDGDGDLDVLTANNLSNPPSGGTISVRRNDGHGVLGGSQEVLVGRGPFQVVLADLDSDGDLDLLSANSADLTGQLSVRFNNGQGDFSTGYELAGDGKNPHGLAVGDVNGDGRLDVLLAFYTDDRSSTSSTVSVLLNDGASPQPSFILSQNVEVAPRPINIAVGDVDNDGDLDFVTASSNTTKASVRLNNGAGQFSGTQEVPIGFNTQAVVLADLDGDGDLDLATANYYDFANPQGAFTSSTSSVRLNDGRGTFGGKLEVPLGQGAFNIVAADVDGDGDLDLLATDEISNKVSVRRNDGTGSFSAGQEVGVEQGAYGLALGDMDGDGKLDIVTSNGRSSTISVRLNMDVVLVATPPPALEELSVYPNPSTDGMFVISYLASDAQTAALTLTDALGRLVQQQHVDVQLGANQMPVATASLAPGIYHLTLMLANGHCLNKKVSLLL
ncbi:FG-GAP-like repeat-containing protein [Hymenobacter ginkgonis]|nr:FG-GAP-like repeat-containing protein [Hymenobacter ginkgonis]